MVLSDASDASDGKYSNILFCFKNGTGKGIRENLDFILNHFSSNGFPRTISTKTTEGRQILVNSKDEALARFKQANYQDCRVNAYSGGDIKGDPNFIFIDIDGTTDHKVIKKILNPNSKFKRIGGHPTVLFTGKGFHIYQPISSGLCLDDFGELANYCHRQQPSREFLKFAENYLSNGKSDPNHNPSFASCLVRIPGSINSKNGNEVQILQKWNGKRPNIALMLGSFMTWLLKNEITGRSKFAKSYKFKVCK